MIIRYKKGALNHVLRHDPDFEKKKKNKRIYKTQVKPIEEINKLLEATEGCDFEINDITELVKSYNLRRRYKGVVYDLYKVDDRITLYNLICQDFGFKPIRIIKWHEFIKERTERVGRKKSDI